LTKEHLTIIDICCPVFFTDCIFCRYSLTYSGYVGHMHILNFIWIRQTRKIMDLLSQGDQVGESVCVLQL